MDTKPFVISYSGGKDSALALCRAVRSGMTPVGMITTYNTGMERSWFHGIPGDLLEDVAGALGIPLTLIPTAGGGDYEEKFLEVLRSFRDRGVTTCVFGDIDIPSHLQWGLDICRRAGMEACFPLWQEPREALVRETVRAGFIANITVVNTRMLSDSHLGRILTEEEMAAIGAEGADICGENGEYHTFVSDGPIFSHPVAFRTEPVLHRENIAVLPISRP